MIPMLEFRRGGRPRFQVRLSRSETRVGRGARCDVTLPEDHVSRVHFLVRRRAESFELVDRSRNGTVLNGDPIDQAEMRVGDVIRLPPWEIGLVAGDGDPTPETAVRDLLNPAPVVSTTHEGDRLLVRAGVLRVCDGPAEGEQYVIRKPEVRVGSDPTCDWVLTGDVAPLHFRVRIEDGRYRLYDSGAPEGTQVDGHLVRDPIELREGARVVAGDTTLELLARTHEDRVRPQQGDRLGDLLGGSRVMRELFQLIRRVAAAEVPVLILGESGTGKELVARALHDHSPRAGGPFVPVNCGALPGDLVESELFGHVKGAFTGATGHRAGAFREARGGTLFLDEIGDLAPAAQVRFLRVLETSRVRPVGADREEPVDVRVVAATHRDLGTELAEGRFREDLFFRLNVGLIRVPPLRARREDVPLLADHLLASSIPGSPPAIDGAAMAVLRDQSWRGNVRALRNVLLRAALLCDGGCIQPAHLQFDLTAGNGSDPLMAMDSQEIAGSLEGAERRAIQNALDACGGNKMAAAKVLGIAKSTLHVKLNRYGMG